MLKLGFDEVWVEHIMKVVSSVTYFFARGQEEFGPLISERGLHQSDPVMKVTWPRGYSWCSSCESIVRVSHLFFLQTIPYFLLKPQL